MVSEFRAKETGASSANMQEKNAAAVLILPWALLIQVLAMTDFPNAGNRNKCKVTKTFYTQNKYFVMTC